MISSSDALNVFSSVTISGTTQLLGVMGDPVEHSLSPTMHNAVLAVMGLDYVYIPLPVKGTALPAALEGLAAIGVRGFNVTIPHKQAIFPLLHEVSPLAQAIGAVNTVWRSGEQWQGTNTDVQGFISPLATEEMPHQTALILGYGGAARAVVAGCHRLGFQHIYIVGRNQEKLEAFRASWRNTEFEAGLRVVPWDDRSALLPQADLVVNSTPLGMAPEGDRSPLDARDLEHLPPHAIVYDLIYTPRPTRLLQLAQNQGLKTIDGAEMLVQQGAAALELWTGRSVPVAVMRNALHQALSSRLGG